MKPGGPRVRRLGRLQPSGSRRRSAGDRGRSPAAESRRRGRRVPTTARTSRRARGLRNATNRAQRAGTVTRLRTNLRPRLRRPRAGTKRLRKKERRERKAASRPCARAPTPHARACNLRAATRRSSVSAGPRLRPPSPGRRNRRPLSSTNATRWSPESETGCSGSSSARRGSPRPSTIAIMRAAWLRPSTTFWG